jgi:hypothetical protein
MTNELSQELFSRNIKALAKSNPELYARFATFKATETSLVFTSDGQADITIGEKLLYDGQSNRLPAHPNLNAEWMKLATDAVSVCTDPLRDKMVGAINEYLAKQGIGQAAAPGSPYFHALVVGVGLGLHIPQLVRASGCRSLILVEPIDEFFFHSLFVTDWASLIEQFENIDGRIDFIIGEEASHSGIKTAAILAHHGYAFVDGALCFLHYRTKETEGASETARHILDQPNGFGWFEDELKMIANTAANFANNGLRMYRRPPQPIPNLLPAFVVGGGPSFDSSLETIRSNAGNVLVGSCGTSLGQLLANGIRPDFHFEIENDPLTFKVLEKVAASYDVSDITLICPTVIDPSAPPLFRNLAFYFRPNLSVNPLFNIFGQDAALLMPHPNGANVALSFFQEIGCREIYFFGIEFGGRDPSRHHSRFSPYMEGGKDAYMKDMQLKSGWKFHIPTPANFGGVSYTFDVGLLAKANIEASIRYFREGRNYFNCSDGLIFEGATPTRPESVLIPPSSIDKAALKNSITADFGLYNKDEFRRAWRREDWAKRAKTRIEELRQALLPRENDTPGIGLARLLGEMPGRLSEGRGTVEDHVFCGTLALAARAAYTAISRTDPPTRRAEVEEFARQEILRILDQMESRYHETLSQVSRLVD